MSQGPPIFKEPFFSLNHFLLWLRIFLHQDRGLGALDQPAQRGNGGLPEARTEAKRRYRAEAKGATPLGVSPGPVNGAQKCSPAAQPAERSSKGVIGAVEVPKAGLLLIAGRFIAYFAFPSSTSLQLTTTADGARHAA
jgi:hypothetical protein